MNSNADISSFNQNSRDTRFTPRQLIKYHMEHPEIPIRDEDIENLILDFPDLRTWNTAGTEDDRSFNFTNKNNSISTFLL